MSEKTSGQSEKIIPPSLHMRTSLMENFVKAMKRFGVSRISDAKWKKGFFVGSHIRKLMKHASFNMVLNQIEKRAFCHKFLGKS